MTPPLHVAGAGAGAGAAASGARAHSWWLQITGSSISWCWARTMRQGGNPLPTATIAIPLPVASSLPSRHHWHSESCVGACGLAPFQSIPLPGVLSLHTQQSATSSMAAGGEGGGGVASVSPLVRSGYIINPLSGRAIKVRAACVPARRALHVCVHLHLYWLLCQTARASGSSGPAFTKGCRAPLTTHLLSS